MKNKKSKTIMFSFIIILMMCVIIGVAYAYFTSNDVVKNTFTMGDVEIELTEPNYNDDTSEKGLFPGSTIYKDPTVLETAGESYMRIILEIQDNDGNIITDETKLEKIKNIIFYDKDYDATATIKTPNILVTNQYSNTNLSSLIGDNHIERLYNSEDFTYDTTRSSGGKLYFNYKGTLVKDDSGVLFTNVVIPTDFTKNDISSIGDFKLVVKAQAIQKAEIVSADAAFTALDGGI